MLRSTLFLFALAVSWAPAPTQGNVPHLLVTSRNGNEVLEFDGTGTFQRVFAPSSTIQNPVGLTFGPDGHLYVSSGVTNRILRYHGVTGALLGTFASGGGLTSSRSLRFGPDGDLYVCCGPQSRVMRFDGKTGQSRGVFALHGSVRGTTSLTFGPDGNLYVGSVTDSVVGRFDGQTGAFLGIFARTGINRAHDVVFGPDGDLYVSNVSGRPNVVRFDGETGAPKGGFVDDPALGFPLGMAFNDAGNLLLANQGGDDVREYDGKTGALLRVFITRAHGGLKGPLFIAFVPNPNGLEVQSPIPAGVGIDAAFGLSGAQPGAFVALAVGGKLGPFPLPWVRMTLGISDAIPLGIGIADPGGRMILRRHVPNAALGLSVHMQAVDFSDRRAVSTVTTHRF